MEGSPLLTLPPFAALLLTHPCPPASSPLLRPCLRPCLPPPSPVSPCSLGLLPHPGALPSSSLGPVTLLPHPCPDSGVSKIGSSDRQAAERQVRDWPGLKAVWP
jgi:hypothetical protein